MIPGKKLIIFILLLCFGFLGYNSLPMQTGKTEHRDIDEQSIPVSCSELSAEQKILNLFLRQPESHDKEWKVCLVKETKDTIAALIVPVDMQQTVNENSVQLEASMINEQYLVFYDISESKFLCRPVRERGISQLYFYEEEERLYTGIIYEISFAGWEEYSMKWLCWEKGTLKRLWNKAERENSYHYWKNRKPVFGEDNTISIFLREGQEGAFETLMQNRELTAMESYSDYVEEYEWASECKFSMAQWIGEGTFLDSGNCSLPGTELVSMLFDIEKTNALPDQIYFSAGFDGAAVELYESLEEEDLGNTYFVVKKYSSSHQAGFQSLYIGSLDGGQRKITQCFEYSGDHSAAKLVSDGERQCILFYAESVSNGIPTTVGGILKAEEGKLFLLWPYRVEDPDAFACEGYWHPCNCGKEEENTEPLPVHRTARLENDRLKVYRINFTFYPDSPVIMGYDLVFEKEIGIEYISEAEGDK
ncbi:MAG: hypothetical protein K2N94_01390 [Lachnospiraceae bacterium]|nr:hypothetical protein [Lachnospiraceae bacterium]